MIHIFKTKNGQFCVVTKANNGEILNVSETFTQKQNAWKNIGAAADSFGSKKVLVQDDCLKIKSKVYVCRIGDNLKMNIAESCIVNAEPRHVSKK